jgi:hypothetical protein
VIIVFFGWSDPEALLRTAAAASDGSDGSAGSVASGGAGASVGNSPIITLLHLPRAQLEVAHPARAAKAAAGGGGGGGFQWRLPAGTYCVSATLLQMAYPEDPTWGRGRPWLSRGPPSRSALPPATQL